MLALNGAQPDREGMVMVRSSFLRWHNDPKQCRHENADVCPTCDHDNYYAATYEDCPWREKYLQQLEAEL
jgi:hypothetical protein